MVHYLGQYITLKLLDAPVIDFHLSYTKFILNYSYWNVYQEVAVVFFGSFSNTLFFLFLIACCYLSQKHIYCFPPLFCRFIAWYGIGTVFDCVFIAIIDFATQDDNGDVFKLYTYYTQATTSGFVGYFLTLLIYFALIIVNSFIFYNYIVFVHLDGRLADIYMRINPK